MGIWYATREAVKAAAGYNGAAENVHVDRLLESAAREIERTARRWFYPKTQTRIYDWPTPNDIPLLPSVRTSGLPSTLLNSAASARRLYLVHLDADLLTVVSFTAGGVVIDAADYFLEPSNEGPPYRRIDRAPSTTFSYDTTPQRSIEVEGRWGYSEVSAAAGALAEGLDASETGVDVTDSSLIGVGDLLLIGTERLVVTEKGLLTTGTTISSDLAAQESVVTVPVADGTKVKAGEVITIDSERFLVESVAGNNLATRRAHDASTLAAHTSGATVYTPRTLTVERGAVGTTAAAHDTATVISRNVPPALISELCLAEVLYARAQEKGHMALTAGQGEAIREISGKGIADLRARAYLAYTRASTVGSRARSTLSTEDTL